MSVPVPQNIAVEEVRRELPEEERVCPQCGDIMEPIGTEAVETLKLIPARAVIHRDVYVKYACQNCKANDIEVPIVETPKKPSLIPGGFASPKAVARIMTQKFLLCVPLTVRNRTGNGGGHGNQFPEITLMR